MLNSVIGDGSVDPKMADLSAFAERFLQNAGMTEAQIAALRAALTEYVQKTAEPAKQKGVSYEKRRAAD